MVVTRPGGPFSGQISIPFVQEFAALAAWVTVGEKGATQRQSSASYIPWTDLLFMLVTFCKGYVSHVVT